MELEISARNIDLGSATREKVERHLRFGLTRFSPSIRRTHCTISDESGPHGAASRRCQIVVKLRSGGHVVVDAAEDSVTAAASAAANRAERAVARHLARKRQSRKYQRRRNAQDENVSTLD